MKTRFTLIFLALLSFVGCSSQNDLIIDAIERDDFENLQDRKITLTEARFDDWAYPDMEEMKKLFSGNDEYFELFFGAEKYHGVKIEIYLYNEVQQADGSVFVDQIPYKLIAFFPYSDERLVKKFKRLYVSGKSIRLTGEYMFVLSGPIWTDTQIQEGDMPALMIKSVS